MLWNFDRRSCRRGRGGDALAGGAGRWDEPLVPLSTNLGIDLNKAREYDTNGRPHFPIDSDAKPLRELVRDESDSKTAFLLDESGVRARLVALPPAARHNTSPHDTTPRSAPMPDPDFTRPSDNPPSVLNVKELPSIPPPFDPPSGRGIGRVDRYDVLEELGQGGMGVVYLGHHPILNRSVALKMIRPKFARDEGIRKRFERECQVLAKLRSDHVVTVHDAGNHQGWPFLVMEYLYGVTLERWFADRKKEGRRGTAAEALRVAAEILRGLATMHALELVHRDIKPANLWVEESGRIKLLDFGLARGPDDDLTKTGNVVGTPSCMAPEQARGEKGVGPRADLFSVGAVLYQLLAGENPFKRDTTATTLLAVQNHEPPPIGAAVPGVPAPLAEFIHRLLAKAPEGRPDDAGRALKELDGVQQRIASTASAANLPPVPPPEGMIGRDALLADVVKRLRDGGALALTGEGGMGKTTLAAAAAHTLRVDAIGVVWVNCEQAVRFEECLREAAAALFGDRCETTPTKQLATRIAEQLTARAALLVLDKFEALKKDEKADEGAEAVQWIAGLRTPARILVTTRAVPSALAKRVIAVRELVPAAAVELFRKKVADAGVSEELPADKIGELCALVGHHPLAIELLAMRAARMPLSLLIESVSQNIFALDSATNMGGKPAPNGVRACFAESFAALDDPARQLLLGMSVLPASFGLEMVTAVTGTRDWHNAAAKLVGASLWRMSNERYTVHPLVRQLAREELGSHLTAAARFAVEKVTGLVRTKAAAARTGRDAARAYLNWCEVELPNLTALAEEAAARGEGATVIDLAGALSAFWTSRGYWDVAERLYRAAADAAAQIGAPAAQAWCLEYLGYVLRHLGRFSEAVTSYKAALALCDRYPEETAPHRPQITSRYGKLCAVLDQHDEAIRLLTTALELSERANDEDGATAATIYLAQSHKFVGDTNRALTLLQGALDRAVRARNVRRRAECLYQFGNTYLRLNQIADAERVLRESLRLSREVDDRVRESQSLVGLGLAAAQSGVWPKAEGFWTEGLQLARALGLRLHEGRAMRRVAELLFDKGELERAREFAREALTILDATEEDRARDHARETLAKIEAALPAQPIGAQTPRTELPR
jgi:serine/threonine protein kinase/tetratricopeptide (TPR) repeat protein/ABC-type transport system involved in cytochrome c biogenesis ATPase subunit